MVAEGPDRGKDHTGNEQLPKEPAGRSQKIRRGGQREKGGQATQQRGENFSGGGKCQSILRSEMTRKKGERERKKKEEEKREKRKSCFFKT